MYCGKYDKSWSLCSLTIGWIGKPEITELIGVFLISF